jgi:hypothetical protein
LAQANNKTHTHTKQDNTYIQDILVHTTYRTILLVFVQHHNFIIIQKVKNNGNYGLTKLNKKLIIKKLPSDVFILLQTLSEDKSRPIGKYVLYENTAENMLQSIMLLIGTLI